MAGPASGSADRGRGGENPVRRPDPEALELYRLRWDLDEAAVDTDGFRTPRVRTPDTETAWRGIEESVARLAH